MEDGESKIEERQRDRETETDKGGGGGGEGERRTGKTWKKKRHSYRGGLINRLI